MVLFVCLPVMTLAGFFNQAPFTEATNKSDVSGRVQVSLPEEKKCTDCHSDLVEKKILHAPVQEGCGICHQVSASEHPEKSAKGLFLTEAAPGLCYSCHDGVKKDIDTTRVVHPAILEKQQCMNCHSPHSSDEKKLLIGDKKELCLGCHDKEIEINGKKTKNIRQLVQTSKFLHPALNGGCTSCHKPHASTDNYLLISAFPTALYVPGEKDNYAVCWECHDSDLLELAQTSTATGFRSGERNLHNVHLKGARGRSCVLCHDVHASNNKYLILDKIAFGKWSFKLNYTPADSGGSCSPGCHGYTVYKRE